VEEGNVAAFAEKYIAEFEHTKALGEAMGLRVFFGVEISPNWELSCHLLAYGVAPDFLRQYPEIYEDTLAEIYRKVHEAGGILVHAHPYRVEIAQPDTDYLDGVEISCHPLYKKSYSKEMIALAHGRGLTLTCGGDYHNDTYRPRCGIYLPAEIEDGVAFGAHLAAADTVELRVHEPYGEEYDLTFTRQTGRKK
jgi:hypothetical protein